MKFVADEGVDYEIVKTLRSNGYDVLFIAEFKAGASDDFVLQSANQEGRLLLTRDKDFGELVFRDQMIHSGIILNRLYELSAVKKAELVLRIIQQYQDELIGAFTVIQPNRIRIRKLKN